MNLTVPQETKWLPNASFLLYPGFYLQDDWQLVRVGPLEFGSVRPEESLPITL